MTRFHYTNGGTLELQGGHKVKGGLLEVSEDDGKRLTDHCPHGCPKEQNTIAAACNHFHEVSDHCCDLPKEFPKGHKSDKEDKEDEKDEKKKQSFSNKDRDQDKDNDNPHVFPNKTPERTFNETEPKPSRFGKKAE